MDATATPAPTLRFNRFLPYWAVLQTDIGQTLRGWAYRAWALMSALGAAGYLLYKVGVHREAGMVQAASVQSEHLLRGLIVGGLGLVALLAVSAIAAERGSAADAVLSRGISRHQYFLAKWHARLLVVVGTFALLAVCSLGAHHFLFDPDLTMAGTLAAVGLVCAILVTVVSWGVTVGALANGTVVGITAFWLILYGGILLLSLLPEPYLTPDRLLARMHFVLRGQYDPATLLEVALLGLVLTAAAAVVGVVSFGRKDV